MSRALRQLLELSAARNVCSQMRTEIESLSLVTDPETAYAFILVVFGAHQKLRGHIETVWHLQPLRVGSPIDKAYTAVDQIGHHLVSLKNGLWRALHQECHVQRHEALNNILNKTNATTFKNNVQTIHMYLRGGRWKTRRHSKIMSNQYTCT